jgi:hypothetical protein
MPSFSSVFEDVVRATEIFTLFQRISDELMTAKPDDAIAAAGPIEFAGEGYLERGMPSVPA